MILSSRLLQKKMMSQLQSYDKQHPGILAMNNQDSSINTYGVIRMLDGQKITSQRTDDRNQRTNDSQNMLEYQKSISRG